MNEKERLEEIRVELRAERISYGELAELALLVDFIEDGDNELLEAAGVPEGEAEFRGLKRVHEKIRTILIDNGNQEYGDCIIDEICAVVGVRPTTDYYVEGE